jgi:hypothetical protein
MNLDTVGGIRANVTRLGSFTPPDRSHPFRMVEEFKRAALMHAAEAGETEREEEEVHGEMRGVAVDRDSGDEAREAGLGGSSKGQEEGMEVETGDIKVEGKRAAQEAQWKVPKTYSIPLLMSMQAHLPYKPFAWPVWKVRQLTLFALLMPASENFSTLVTFRAFDQEGPNGGIHASMCRCHHSASMLLPVMSECESKHMSGASVKSIYGCQGVKNVKDFDSNTVFVRRYCQVLSSFAQVVYVKEVCVKSRAFGPYDRQGALGV